MNIAGAISALQAHALELTAFKFAPTTPPEAVNALPASVAFIESGSCSVDDASSTRELYTIRIDLHFNRANMRNAYTAINAAIPQFVRILAGDPTLGGAVDTIIFPVQFTVQPMQWNELETLAAVFQIQVKIRETPTA